jgi:hypothetical protein
MDDGLLQVSAEIYLRCTCCGVLCPVSREGPYRSGPGFRGDQSGDLDRRSRHRRIGGQANVVVFGPNSEMKYVAPNNRTR